MDCITTTSLHFWNGEPKTSLKPSRGIRQGEPLSPYLFFMCMERLYQTIEEAIVEHQWKTLLALIDRCYQTRSIKANRVFH